MQGSSERECAGALNFRAGGNPPAGAVRRAGATDRPRSRFEKALVGHYGQASW